MSENTGEIKTDFPGAKWWKFDFHTHTPASSDFMQGCSEDDKDQVTPEHWLRRFMDKNIDCVAITDHNSGAWIDKLKNTLVQIKENQPDWYRDIHLFPGVEISVQGGIHILAVFGTETEKSDIDSLLGAVGYHGEKGKSDKVTQKSVTEVADIIVKRGGIAIPSHADKAKGLFEVCTGTTLENILDNDSIFAMELCDEEYQKPQLYGDKKTNWTEIIGSDVHNFRVRNFGSHFTWIKMDIPSIEGLRLALLDGQASARRDTDSNPNRHADFVIESLAINKARYMGRLEPMECRFSPFLTTLIGGRGSGKSTILEFMRMLFRREAEIPETLKSESRKYFETGGDNLLTDTSNLSLIYLKGDTRYRLNWSSQPEEASLERQVQDGTWQPEAGEINPLFPVRIYSQKQIFELSREPEALLDIIDQAPEVESNILEERREHLVQRYKLNTIKLLDLEQKITTRNRIEGECNEYERQIKQIEDSGHKEVLQTYRKRQRQLLLIEQIENDWKDMADSIESLLPNEINDKDSISPMHVADDVFSPDEEPRISINRSNQQWAVIREKLQNLVNEARQIIDDWHQEKERAEWMRLIRIDMSRYEQLKHQLEQRGIDPEQYPRLLQQRELTRQKLHEIDKCSRQQELLNQEQEQLFEEVKSVRDELTRNRKKFLESVLVKTDTVNIKVIDYGQDWSGIEKDLRAKLSCDDRFNADIEALKGLYNRTGTNSTHELKQRIEDIRKGNISPQDYRFARHLQNQNRETLADLKLWFPKDNLEITFGKGRRSIRQGSPGQKTAALLAFILSYGKEPLLLDQPEDDLDNELIYDLIVKQIREIKPQRQIIIVTHNANIVVNGDAEMVLPLTVSKGQTYIKRPASIQENHVREKICVILEGGKEAFDQRYKRIKLEVH